MIEAQGLTRRYGDYTAVDDISFTVAEGEILGILGPNGAGKTTTIRMITGFLPPSRGAVTVNGHDLFTEPSHARREIGYLPESVALYPEMRVCEYLQYRAQLEGMKRAAGRDAIEDCLDRCLLRDVERQIIGTLSKGYRQRVGLATAILHRPSVLVLDEPTVGLDPRQIIAIRELIRELGKKRTLMVSTHILPEVEQLCDRVLIIDGGKIVAEGTPAALREQARGNPLLTVTVAGDPAPMEGALEAFGSLPGVQTVEPTGHSGQLQIECERDQDLRAEVFQTAVARGWILLELVEKATSLEDVFVRLTQHDQAELESVQALEGPAPPATTEMDEEVAS